MLGQGTFLLADLSGAVFPKPVNGFRSKKFYGPNPMDNVVGIQQVSVVGQNDGEYIRSMHYNHIALQITKASIFCRSFRLAIHTSECEFFYCMAEEWKRQLSIDTEIVEAFIHMSKQKGVVRRSPRMKEIKEDSSYLPRMTMLNP